jgi:hypothetical protein
LISLALLFGHDSVEPLITAQLRGNCTHAWIQAILRTKPQTVSRTPWLEVVSAAEVTEGAAGIFVTRASGSTNGFTPK